MSAPGLHYPPHPPPEADLHARAVWHARARAWWREADLHARAVWHARARAWWREAAAAARPRSTERRNRLAWASQHEARVVALAWAAHNAPITTDPSLYHGRP